MGAFYRVDFRGRAGLGAGALALANGKVAGLDVGGAVYTGSYTEEADRLQGTVKLSFPGGGGLVTGIDVSRGAEVAIPFDIPAGHIPGGHRISVIVPGGQVDAQLTWVADL